MNKTHYKAFKVNHFQAVVSIHVFFIKYHHLMIVDTVSSNGKFSVVSFFIASFQFP